MSEPYLVICVQSLKLLIVARLVREVLGEIDWVAIPGTRHELPGVIGWGRRAVALLDLARLAPGMRPLRAGEKRDRTLLLQVAESFLAIPADSVSSIIDIDAASIRPRTLTDFPLCRGEVHLDGDLLPLFDPAMLLESAGIQ